MNNDVKADLNLQTLGRNELTHEVSSRLKLPEKVVRTLLEEMLDEIAKSLEQGEDVKFTNFGTFRLLQKNKRIARNPKTKEPAVVSSRRVLSFKAARLLIERTGSAFKSQ